MSENYLIPLKIGHQVKYTGKDTVDVYSQLLCLVGLDFVQADITCAK